MDTNLIILATFASVIGMVYSASSSDGQRSAITPSTVTSNPPIVDIGLGPVGPQELPDGFNLLDGLNHGTNQAKPRNQNRELQIDQAAAAEPDLDAAGSSYRGYYRPSYGGYYPGYGGGGYRPSYGGNFGSGYGQIYPGYVQGYYPGYGGGAYWNLGLGGFPRRPWAYSG